MQKIEPDVVSAVKADWFRKLLKKLSEGKPFDMEGLNVVYEIDANKSATEDDARRLQRDFAAMQWEKNIWFWMFKGTSIFPMHHHILIDYQWFAS